MIQAKNRRHRVYAGGGFGFRTGFRPSEKSFFGFDVEKQLFLFEAVAVGIGQNRLCGGMFDNGKVQAAGIGQRGIDNLAGFRTVFQHGDSGGFQRTAGQYGQAAFDLCARAMISCPG